MQKNCIYIYACGGSHCANCAGYQSITECKRRYKNAKTAKMRKTLKQYIDQYERRLNNE